MTLLRPRIDSTPPDASDAEALIREARRLRRRRWAVGLLIAAVAGAGIGWALAGNTHGPTAPTTRATRHDATRDNSEPGYRWAPTPISLRPGHSPSHPPAPSTWLTSTMSGSFRLPNGRFRVIAGDGKKGVSGDGGPAVDAEFLDVVDMAVGPDGSLYVVDGDRVRVVSTNGVISTIAGIAGMGTSPPCCSSTALPPPIPNGTPALSVSIDQLNSAAIALSEQGVLYISTGMQILRLDAGTLDVIATRAIDPPYNGQPLPDLGQIAVDALGNLDVSGGNGWAIWQVAPNGVATEVTSPNARRSGGNTSVLERAPDGLVYGESGPTFLKLQGGRAIPGYSFPQKPRSGFWLTYFAFGPNGAVYADEIPGFGAWEKYQQLRIVHGNRSSVLWQQTSAPVAPVAS